MVAKQWYDHERTSFNFIKKAADSPPIQFNYQHDFDENGIIYWIGTNGKAAYDWVNPGTKLNVYFTKKNIHFHLNSRKKI